MEETNVLIPNLKTDDKIPEYFNLKNKITMINQINRSDTNELHIINRHEYNAIIQLLIPNNSLKSFESISSELTFNNETNIEQIQNFILNNLTFDNCEEDIQNNDYIEWSLNRDYLIIKSKQFRTEIDLYKTYDNQHHLITKLIIEIIEYYVKEYLIEQELFSKEETRIIANYFQKAIDEQNYLKYFIKAYTLTNKFYHVLNKHLALYFLHYFNTPSYSSLKTKYRLINCLAHMVSLLIYHPDIEKYRFNGITYRGLLMKRNHLKFYSTGNHILNKSFVSTSKSRLVARIFADYGEDNDQIPVLIIYTIKRNETAIDIEHLSMIPDEEEVLILPFSVFKVKNRIERSSDTTYVEIHLEECQQIDYQKQTDESSTTKYENTIKFKYLKISIGLCFIISLTFILSFIVKNEIKSNDQLWNEKIKKNVQQSFNNHKQLRIPNLKINQTWEQNGTTIAGGLGIGNGSNQLNNPSGLFIDDDQTIYIADSFNHRIMEWKNNTTNGHIVAGGNGEGSGNKQLRYPTRVIVDQENDSLIICDSGNQRIMRWPRRNDQTGEILLSSINCYDLIMDNDGYLYISDSTKHEVTQWKMEKTYRIINVDDEKKHRLNQINSFYCIFVDADDSLYVSDFSTHRVMKWMKGLDKGIVVAGGQKRGNSSRHLSYPAGIIVDQLNSVYVVDSDNHRVMRWLKGAEEGTMVVGGNEKGQQSNRLNYPEYLSFDRHNNLYVVDQKNHRVQKFNVN